MSFFLFLCFIFIAHFFRGLVGACVNPGSFLFVYSIVCPITTHFLMDFSQTLFNTSPSMLYLSYYFHPKENTCHVLVNGYYTAG